MYGTYMGRGIGGSDPRQNLRHLKRGIGVDLGQGETSMRSTVYCINLNSATLP